MDRPEQVIEEIRKISAQIELLLARMKNIEQLCAPFGVSIGDGTVLVQTSLGDRYFVPIDDYSIAPKMIGSRVWEPRVTSLFVQIVKPQMNFVDVGAYFGYYTCLVARLLGPMGGKVFAIEPNPRAQALIVRNVNINWSCAPVELLTIAVGNSRGLRTLIVPDHFQGDSSFYLQRRTGNSFNRRNIEDGAISTTQVEVDTLDQLFPEPYIVDLIKMDIEGSEFEALVGAEALIRRSKNIQMVLEWSQDHLRKSLNEPEALIDLLKSLQLMPHLIEEKARPLTWSELLDVRYGNLWLKK